VCEWINRYQFIPLGFVDSSVIACAKRLKAHVMTLDIQHYPVVAREGTFRIAD
jgi:predicted nucleic acid-binding protein